MKKIVCLLFVTIFSVLAFAQVQHGIVKTRGRIVNGQLVAGIMLPGATITLNIGNPLVSGDDGAFSFNVPSDKKYSLVSAKKQGYTLADPEYTRRSFKYSADNTFYVVLVDEAQRQADINAAIRKVRRTLTAQLQKREDEIESLKEQNRLTEEEYQKRLKELYDNQSKSEQLVKDMAERYASTDYDQLDEFNRQVQQYIEDGELQKADSMIQSKGNLEDRVSEFHKIAAANKKEREFLDQRELALNQSERGVAKTYEDISLDLLCRSEIFLQSYQQDSALYYLKIRADLDTTKVDAVMYYAKLSYEQMRFEDCESYYMICLRYFVFHYDISNIAIIQNNLGKLYKDMHNFELSEKYLKLALENSQTYLKQNLSTDITLHAGPQINLGNLYLDFRKYESCEKYYKSALEKIELLFKDNPEEYRSSLFKIQQNLGALHSTICSFSCSEEYYALAMNNMDILFSKNPDFFRVEFARLHHNIGNLYLRLQDYEKCERFLNQALENWNILYNQNPDANRRNLALTQMVLGNLYLDNHIYEKSEFFLNCALENWSILYSRNQDAGRNDLAFTQSLLGDLYYYCKKYENSIYYYNLALANYDILFQENEATYREDLTKIQASLGDLYNEIDDFKKSESFYISAIDNMEVLLNITPEKYRYILSFAQFNLGNIYYAHGQLLDSEKYLLKTLRNCEILFEQDAETFRISLATTCRIMMLLYYDMENKEQYDIMLDRTLALYKELFVSQPVLYVDNIIELKSRIVRRMLERSEFDNALETAKEVYAMDESKEDTKQYLAECYNLKAYEYANGNDFVKADELLRMAISLDPTNAIFYDSIGEILLMQGKNEESLEMWNKIMELNPEFLKDYPDGTNLSNGLKKLGLIE